MAQIERGREGEHDRALDQRAAGAAIQRPLSIGVTQRSSRPTGEVLTFGINSTRA